MINSERTDLPVNILLVDDDPDDVLFVKQALAGVWIHYILHIVEDGEAALNFLRRAEGYAHVPSPDLILLDLNMPKINGHEVLADIKQDEALKHIPVVILSTTQDPDAIHTSYRLHANSFITKPASPREFNRIVELVVDYWFSAIDQPPRQESASC